VRVSATEERPVQRPVPVDCTIDVGVATLCLPAGAARTSNRLTIRRMISKRNLKMVLIFSSVVFTCSFQRISRDAIAKLIVCCD